ncbi:ArnT family glycosyltransferase [Salinisphaera aquimarina]|uniref:ArnT family glycosyltransferase n=1 Tax=Salinisphaera aquimarina TaxID=2094031 RepID=A0ABV7ETI3_9GAMM
MTCSRFDWIAMTLLGALVLGVALGGSTTIPLDSHEVYVAQTAENMIESGDWVVPRLNAQPRLTKPPLSYWATAVVALVGADHQVRPLDVRMPSIVAGLGLVWLVFLIGRGERDSATGLLAGLIALTSIGFFRYVHDGRPDMLYTFFATLMVFAWWAGGRAGHMAGMRAWGLVFWAAFGLHVLTKGPQFGAVILAACLIHALCVPGERRRLLVRLQLLPGLLLFAVLVVPWWWLLDQRIGPSLEQSQLSGSLLTVDPLRLLNPYYWLRTPLQWAPWLVAIVPAATVAWSERDRTPGLLALVVLLPVVIFTLGPQYREIYMLPSMAPAALLLAFGVERLTVSIHRRARVGLYALALFLFVFCIGGWIWLGLNAGGGWAAFALCALATAVLLVLAAIRLRQTRRGVISLLGIAMAAALMQAAVVPVVWSASRYTDRALAMRLLPFRDRPMAVFDHLASDVFVYYLDRPITELRDEAALCAWLADPSHRSGLLLYNPLDARRVTATAPGLSRLMASPGSERSAVIVARAGAPAKGCQTAAR